MTKETTTAPEEESIQPKEENVQPKRGTKGKVMLVGLDLGTNT